MKELQLSKRFDQALLYARKVHSKQFRKGTGIPYISHLLAVAGIVMEHGGDEDEVIAALLHDAVEDGGGRPVLDGIRRRFGVRVAEIVEGCSDTDLIPKPPWKERKVRYIKQVKKASASVVLVSAADKLHNARAILSDYRQIGEQLWSRFTGEKDGTLWYYEELVKAFSQAGKNELNELVEELDRVVTKIKKLSDSRS